MSDFNIDLLVNIATKGGPQATQAVKQLTDAAANGNKAAAEALKNLNTELAKQADETKKAETETEAESKQTKKATTAKDEYKAAVKGLGLEFPILARVMGLLTNPLTALIAGFGTVIGLVKSYADEVSAAGIASAKAFEGMASQVESLRTINARLAADWKTNAAEMATDLDGPQKALDEFNRALLLKAQLADEQASAESAKAIDDIQNNSKLTPNQRNQQIYNVQAADRKRRQDAAESTLQTEANNAELTARYQREAARRAAEGAEGMKPQIAQQTKTAQAAAEDKTNKAQASATALPKMMEMLEYARGLEEALKNGQPGGMAYNLLHPQLAGQFKEQAGTKSLEEFTQQLVDDIKVMSELPQNAATLAEQEAGKLKELQARYAKLISEAQQNNTDAAANESTANEKYGELKTRRSARGQRDPIIEGMESTRAQRQAKEENLRRNQEGAQMDEEWNDYESGRSKNPPDFSVPAGKSSKPRPQFEQTPIDPRDVADSQMTGRRDALNARADKAYREVQAALEEGNMQGAKAWDEQLKANEKMIEKLQQIYPALLRQNQKLDAMNSSGARATRDG